MDSQPLPGLGLSDGALRSRIFGALTKGWMAFDGRWKLCKYSEGEALLFDLESDPTEQRNLATDPAYGHVYRRLDAELTHEVMEASALRLHDRLVAPHSLAGSDEFAREGWQWSFPSDASEATKVGDDYY